MKYKTIVFGIALALMVSIGANAVMYDQAYRSTQSKPAPLYSERFVYIAATSDRNLIASDIRGMQAFAREYGVNVEILSPKEFDAVEQVSLLQGAIESKPDGILISAWDPSLVPYVNQAIDAGIPTITVETDLPESKRLAYVGIDWYGLGVQQADELAAMIGETGTVAVLGILGADSTDQGFAGFAAGMKKYENIYMLQGFDDMGTVEEAERITKQILATYPVTGIAGFDINSGIGISLAVRELGLEGKVKVTCIGMTQTHMKYLKDGTIQKVFDFLREQFTYYGCKLLYENNHNTMQITNEDDKKGITNIPQAIDTEYIELDSSSLVDD